MKEVAWSLFVKKYVLLKSFIILLQKIMIIFL